MGILDTALSIYTSPLRSLLEEKKGMNVESVFSHIKFYGLASFFSASYMYWSFQEFGFFDFIVGLVLLNIILPGASFIILKLMKVPLFDEQLKKVATKVFEKWSNS